MNTNIVYQKVMGLTYATVTTDKGKVTFSVKKVNGKNASARGGATREEWQARFVGGTKVTRDTRDATVKAMVETLRKNGTAI